MSVQDETPTQIALRKDQVAVVVSMRGEINLYLPDLPGDAMVPGFIALLGPVVKALVDGNLEIPEDIKLLFKENN